MKRGCAVSEREQLVAGLDGHELPRIEVGDDLPEEGSRIGRTGRRAKRQVASHRRESGTRPSALPTFPAAPQSRSRGSAHQ